MRLRSILLLTLTLPATPLLAAEPEGRGEVSFGNLDYIQAKASVSGPLVADKVAARLSGSYTTRKGMLFNTITDRYVNEIDNLGLRGQIFRQATETLDITLSGDRNRQNPAGFAQNYVVAVPTQRPANRQFANLARLSNYAPSRFQNVEGYVLTNFRGGYRTDSGWDVFGWVRNAFDTEYFDFLTAAPGSTGLIVGQPGDPRTYGTTVSRRF